MSQFCKVCDEKLKTAAERKHKICNECDKAIDKLVEKKVEYKRVGFTSGAHTLRKKGKGGLA